MMRVLIVEDDSLERKALGALFSLCFPSLFEVIYAPDGKTALTRIDTYPLNLVILDINLPDTSGLDVLHEVKERFPSLSVIMATAYGDYEHLRSSMRDGAADYLIKPYSMETFQEAVERFLKKQEHKELFGTKGTAGKILQFLETHYHENISLDDLAVMVNHDRSYVAKIFKKEYGTTVFSALEKIRMNKAKELLADGMSVAETARNVGYADPAYFGKCFKKATGINPHQWQ